MQFFRVAGSIFQRRRQRFNSSHNEAFFVASCVSNENLPQWRFTSRVDCLEQAEQFENDHDNDNYSDYVEDVSIHARDSYQSNGVVGSVYRE